MLPGTQTHRCTARMLCNNMNMLLYVNAAPLFRHMDSLRCVPRMGALRVCCIHAE